MNKLISISALFFALLFSAQADAAGQRPSDMTASSAIVGTQIVWCPTPAGPTDFKCTFTQIATYINSLFSGDATAASGGALTLATVNANVGSFGSSTSCAAFTVNAKGLITAASASTCAPAIGSVTGLGTGVGTALGVNTGSAGAFVVNGGALGTPTSGTATNLTGLPIAGITGLGTGVGTAFAANLSAAGGLTTTIASGTAALGTGAITSGTCATVVTVAATNVATTDIVAAGFAADPTATTGYLPTAMLTIVPYPTSGNVNFKVCNLTSGSITPSAVTINWRVTR